MGERTSEEEVNERLGRAGAWALRGKQQAEKAKMLLWCAQKKDLLRQSEESLRRAAEELSFVKYMR